MSSKFKFIGIALVALLSIGLFTSTATADVTGSFETHFVLIPQTTASEVELIDFDVQNALNVTVVVSGLSSTFHTHFGIAGVEDIILSSAVSLGALSLSADLVFGRFAGECLFAIGPTCFVPTWDTLPESDAILFIKKRVEASLELGGVTFSNLAIFEDTNFTQGNGFEGQSQAFAFGDVFSLSGQTPSGVSITASTGICAEQAPNVIKKHQWPYSVNPDCSPVDGNTIPSPGTFDNKPDILFDFENISISGVPVASGVVGSAVLNCVRITACSLVTTFSFSGTAIPFSTSLTFTDLLSLEFDGADIIFSSGAGTAVLEIDETGSLTDITVSVEAVLNPDTNPATLELELEASPGVGITEGTVALIVQRAGLIFFGEATFTGAPAELSAVEFGIDVPGSLLNISTDAVFSPAGLVVAEVLLTINF